MQGFAAQPAERKVLKPFLSAIFQNPDGLQISIAQSLQLRVRRISNNLHTPAFAPCSPVGACAPAIVISSSLSSRESR